jgi:hypothetical protein
MAEMMWHVLKVILSLRLQPRADGAVGLIASPNILYYIFAAVHC